MKRYISLLFLTIPLIFSSGCSTSYKVKPLPFKSPATLKNVVSIAGADVAARAFVDKAETKEAFGFDIHGAGMLPVQVVFDNQGQQSLEINAQQTFLEDEKGNLWPILSKNIAYERATKYAQTKKIFEKGAYHGFWGAAAGSIIGAAIGIVSGENVAIAAGTRALQWVLLPEPPWEVPPEPTQAMFEDQLSMTYVKNLFKIRPLSRKALPTAFCFSPVKPNRPSSFASS